MNATRYLTLVLAASVCLGMDCQGEMPPEMMPAGQALPTAQSLNGNWRVEIGRRGIGEETDQAICITLTDGLVTTYFAGCDKLSLVLDAQPVHIDGRIVRFSFGSAGSVPDLGLFRNVFDFDGTFQDDGSISGLMTLTVMAATIPSDAAPVISPFRMTRFP